ncbi:diaminopimelate epimerase [Elusimicrobiota bacterium]
MKRKFVKVEGGGNDFILFDMLDIEEKAVKWKKYVPAMCERKKGIGADGVLILERDLKNNFRMRIFNPDGQEVEMCGNGARCCAYYYCLKENIDSMRISTIAGVMSAAVKKNRIVQLNLPSPTETELDILINVNGREMGVSFINTGVPHAVIETKKIEDIDVNKLGRGIRYNRRFAPNGTNADFVQVTGPSSLKVRTYERGVESETLACGTGVVASAIIETLKERVTAPVSIKTRGGEIMKVYFNITEKDDLLSRINNVRLEGKVKLVYKGTVELK